MVLNKPKRIHVDAIEFPEDTIITSVSSQDEFDRLRKNQTTLETETDLFLIQKEGLVYRFMKPNVPPRIIRVEKLELNPDHYGVRLQLSVEQLFEFCRRERLWLFETSDSYILPGETILYAQKQKEKATA